MILCEFRFENAFLLGGDDDLRAISTGLDALFEKLSVLDGAARSRPVMAGGGSASIAMPLRVPRPNNCAAGSPSFAATKPLRILAQTCMMTALMHRLINLVRCQALTERELLGLVRPASGFT